MLIRLSQGQLNLLETCPPKFQQVYLEQLIAPINPELQEKLDWGNQFHLLMQQREIGLPIDSLLSENQQLQHSIQALVKAVPEINQSDEQTWRDPEHYRSVQLEGYLLTAVYDLLILQPQQAQILDWKTYLQPENRKKLANNWQTRLYLYILAETSDYLPEDISMTYWFVKLPTQPQHLTFNYNSAQHQQTKADLTHLLQQLNQYLDNYLQQKQDFPHLPNCKTVCPYFQSQETTIKETHISQDLYSAIAQIEEVPLDL